MVGDAQGHGTADAALTLYDQETCAFIRDMPRAGLDSYDQKMQRNADGSVDIYNRGVI